MTALCFRPCAALLALAAALAAMLAAPACLAQGQDEQLKAAYILNIALFTTWPPLPGPPRAMMVCASPQHTLWDSLRQLDGRNVNGRTWTTLDAAGAKSCDIVVIAAASAPRSAPKEPGSALYVVDGAVAGAYAGAIVLVEESQHIRFDVDTREAARAGIKFSSRLLRLARNVL